MCMGGGDSPSAPVNPAPYPYAELDVKDARAPDPNAHGNEATPTVPKASNTGPLQGSTGANFDNIKM